MALSQSLLDELWDFSDPVASEARLRAAADSETDAASRAELQTQVARSLGLQERFDDGDAVLDGIDTGGAAVDVRVALERGRLRNSSGDAAAAVPLFRRAALGAASAGLVFLQIDALHMLAIADADGAQEWTATALEVLEGVDDPRTLRWRVGLHNNAGWALFDAGRFDDAVARFEASRDAAVRYGTTQQVEWADEAIAEARAAAGPQA
jgi:hypothetical protein